ncbi:MAG: hypothetical protein WCJ33_00330 [Pseudomonadota bacterium]
MAKAIFLSEEVLKASSVLNENIDMKLLTPIIKKVQELRILELMGTALYNDMMDKIDADKTLSAYPNYKTLLVDYIQPCMIQYCVCDSTPELLFKFMNVGLNKKSTANTQAVSYDEALKMIERYQADAEIYQSRLVKYLIAKANTLFPLYFATGTDISYIYPKRNSFTSPIFLDDRESRNTWRLNRMQGGPTFPNNFGECCDW